jgi:hypothetical protein
MCLLMLSSNQVAYNVGEPIRVSLSTTRHDYHPATIHPTS